LKPERREEVKQNQVDYIVKTHKALINPGRQVFNGEDIVLLKNEKQDLKKELEFSEIGTVIEVFLNITYRIKVQDSEAICISHADQ
jgi:hypothetical protein